ncbi:MAG: Mur ligase family protein, partial [Pseudomonadota bacterium]
MNQMRIRKSLSSLLKNYVTFTEKIEIEITGLTLDSRSVQTGELFFAYKGASHDGRDFIQQACENGAAAILYEPDNSQIEPANFSIPVIPLKNLREQVGYIAANYYDNPSQTLNIIAVTGTNGKTSCCQHLAQALGLCGYKTGVVGTLGNGIFGTLEPSLHTTPSPIAIQKQLYEFNQDKVAFVIIEASSHGLDQGRLNGVEIDIAIFTNLTRDHLDYHGDMQSYGNAKAKLFKFPSLKYTV